MVGRIEDIKELEDVDKWIDHETSKISKQKKLFELIESQHQEDQEIKQTEFIHLFTKNKHDILIKVSNVVKDNISRNSIIKIVQLGKNATALENILKHGIEKGRLSYKDLLLIATTSKHTSIGEIAIQEITKFIHDEYSFKSIHLNAFINKEIKDFLTKYGVSKGYLNEAQLKKDNDNKEIIKNKIKLIWKDFFSGKISKQQAYEKEKILTSQYN